MRTVTAALLIGLAGAPAVQAGAWLREKGSAFVSTTVATNEAQQHSTGIYLEYGLSDRFTLGGDFHYGSDLTTYQDGSGIVFLRFPLGPADRTHKWAAHVGAGVRYTQMTFSEAVEVGVSWGRGIQWRERYGWLGIDTSYNDAGAPAEARVKIDGTIGMALGERSKVMLQMFNTFEDGQTYSVVAPSYLFSSGSGRTTFQISLEAPISGVTEASLKIGIWQNF